HTTTGVVTFTSSTGSNGNINDTVTMAAGATITYTVTATVLSTATAQLDNFVTLTPPGGSPIVPHDKDNVVHMTVVKTDNVGGSSATGPVGTVDAGNSITYTIVVTNDGSATATGATIVDNLPFHTPRATDLHTTTGVVTFTSSTGSNGNINDTVTMAA